MSLKNVILPDILIAELYKNVFIINETVARSREEEVSNQTSEVKSQKPEVGYGSEIASSESEAHTLDAPVGDTEAGTGVLHDTMGKEPGSKAVKFLGNNLKNVLIVVRHSEDVFLPEKHLEFLTRLLAACKLNIGDIAIVNDGYTSVDIHSLQQQLKPKKVILFGIEPTEIKLPLNFPNFKVQNYADSVYLSVPSLDILNHTTEDKLLKTKLWVCLMSMFDVN
jgi:hypothetical protein